MEAGQRRRKVKGRSQNLKEMEVEEGRKRG